MKCAKKANKHAESDIKVNLLKWLFGVNLSPKKPW